MSIEHCIYQIPSVHVTQHYFLLKVAIELGNFPGLWQYSCCHLCGRVMQCFVAFNSDAFQNERVFDILLGELLKLCGGFILLSFLSISFNNFRMENGLELFFESNQNSIKAFVIPSIGITI